MRNQKKKRKKNQQTIDFLRKDIEPDWGTPCDNCGAVPIMPITGMYGPCTTGEANTVGGNW